eukprot:GFUD01004208.1.p1 GENE.GFUD01004208.1~~GFUD01004208.1.p1  ORF type:complete len:408 (+),score=65.43 GFUD01004208.1:34-1257(+)
MELSSNQIRLALPGHRSSLGKVLLEDLPTSIFTDLQIVTKSGIFVVHKALISKAFSKFTTINLTKETDSIYFPEVDGDDMRAAIEELYVENHARRWSQFLRNSSENSTDRSEDYCDEIIGDIDCDTSESINDCDIDSTVAAVKIEESDDLVLEMKKIIKTNDKSTGESLSCTECGKTFSRASKVQNLEAHMLSYHTPAECEECKKYFRNKQRLIQHKLKVHNANNVAKVTCELCGKQLSSLYITEHKAVMHQTRGLRKCKECDFETYSRSVLQDHRNKIHSRDTFPCTLCGKVFQTSKVRYDHESKVHGSGKSKSEEKLLTCDACGKTFNQKYKLMGHMKRLHNTGNTHTCQICEKQFTSLEYLKKHVRGHEEKRPCTYCSKMYTFASMVYHKRNCSQNPNCVNTTI